MNLGPASAKYLLESIKTELIENRENIHGAKLMHKEMKHRVRNYPGGSKVWSSEVRSYRDHIRKTEARRKFLLQVKKELSQ